MFYMYSVCVIIYANKDYYYYYYNIDGKCVHFNKSAGTFTIVRSHLQVHALLHKLNVQKCMHNGTF